MAPAQRMLLACVLTLLYAETAALELPFEGMKLQEAGCVDIVWVLDASGSMADDQSIFADSTRLLFEGLGTVDFRLGVMGFAGFNCGDPHFVVSVKGAHIPGEPGTGEWTREQESFAGMVKVAFDSSGGVEEGLRALSEALQWFDFRGNCRRVLILVTDEDADESDSSGMCRDATDMGALIAQIVSDGAMVHTVYYSADRDGYEDLAPATGGLQLDIDSSWGTNIRVLTSSILAHTVPPKVIRTIPQGGTADVPIDAYASVAFSKPIDTLSLPGAISAVNSENIAVGIEHELDTSLTVLMIRPDSRVRFWPPDDTLRVALGSQIRDTMGLGFDGNGDGMYEPDDAFDFWFSTAPGVRPGDANNDGVVNEADILPLGRYWKRCGPSRARNTDTWSLEAARPWNPREATYADCDGSGCIDSADICPIAEFFSWVATAKRQSSGACPIDRTSIEEDVLAAMYQGLRVCSTTNSAGATALGQLLGTYSTVSIAPRDFVLWQNYPNPFNTGTVIRYSLPSESSVRLEVFDILGRKVATPIDGLQSAGRHSVMWDGLDNTGQALASGMYFYRIIAGTLTESRKMVLLK